MLSNKIKITVLSDLNYENLVAEVLIDESFLGTVTKEPGRSYELEIPPSKVAKSLNLKVVTKALNMAIEELEK